MTPAILISVSALLFTVGSFWWLYVRPGRLRMSEVTIFAAYIRPEQAVLRLPIALYNTGAKPLVVVDFVARIESNGLTGDAASKLFRSSIRPHAEDVEDFAHPFVVAGRSVVTKFVEFDANPAVMATGIPATVSVRALISRRGWRPVGQVPVRTDIIGDPESFIAYSNNPSHWPKGQQDKAKQSLEKLRSAMASTGK